MIKSTKPKIAIDETKCRFSLYDPRGCKKCLEICPVVVFGCVPAEERKVGGAPTIYKLTVVWEELCNNCGACVKACPASAITVGMYPWDESSLWQATKV